MVGSTDTDLTPSPASKPKRNHMEDYLPLYKKAGESFAELKIRDKTSGKHDLSISKGSPKHERSLSKRPTLGKQAVDVSHIIIDGTNLYSSEPSAGHCTPLNESKVTSNSKKTAKSAKEKIKKNAPTIEHSKTMNNVTENSSQTQSHKRSKSVNFLLKEKDHAVAKITKSDVSQERSTDDIPKAKVKKNKKSEQENEAICDRANVDETAPKKKHKKIKNKSDKLKTEETPILDNNPDQEDSLFKDRKFNKRGKKENKVDKELNTEINQEMVKTKKAKKQKLQDKSKDDENDGEPASKSSKTEVADHLENLNLGDNTHSLTNLIDKMSVVDKAKLKKMRKTANRKKKRNQMEQQTETVDKKPKQTEINDIKSVKNLNENGTGDSEKPEESIEKKKWVTKRWNKHQVAERDQNTTLNIDNLPVSMLKGNYKKVLIDHFSKYGLSRSVGEPFIFDEEDPNSVFTTRIYFDTREAAAQALEMDESTVAGNVIRVSLMRPMTETAIVLRMYGARDKCNAKDVGATFKEVGLIRSIRRTVNKKKTMVTVFVEFDGSKTVQRALKKCDNNLQINGVKVMAKQYVVTNNEDKAKKTKKRKRSSSRNKKGNEDSEKASIKNSKKVPNKNSKKVASDKNSDSDDESDDE